MILRSGLKGHLAEECKLSSICSGCNSRIDSSITTHGKCILQIEKEIDSMKEKLTEYKKIVVKFNKIQKKQPKAPQVVEEVKKVEPKKEVQRVGRELMQCPDCGRKFNEDAFEKHSKVCAKVNAPRAVFDVKKQRLGELANEIKEEKKEEKNEESNNKSILMHKLSELNSRLLSLNSSLSSNK